MTIQEAKDQAARERGYDQFESVIDAQNISSAYDDDFKEIINRSLEIFAEAKAKEAYTEGVKDWEAANEKANKILDGLREKSKYVEAYNQGVMDAAESAEATFDYMEYDEVRFPNEKSIIVNKDSILKLLK